MSYTPTEWKKGDVVTSEKLNKLEGGVAAGGVLVVEATLDAGTQDLVLNKTAGEIFAAKFAVMQIDLSDYGLNGTGYGAMSLATQSNSGYTFAFTLGPDTDGFFAASTADDYPVSTSG